MKETEPVIHSDPEIMGGTPVFIGTRVPLATLLDYLEAGQPLSEFLLDHPGAQHFDYLCADRGVVRSFVLAGANLD